MRSVYSALSGFFLGAAAFFTFIVPGAAFSVLPLDAVGRLFNRVFPGLYLFQAVSAALMLVLSVRMRPRGAAMITSAAIALVFTLASWLWLLPAVNRSVGTAQFGALHGLSLGLELLSMVVVLVGLVASLRASAK